MKAKLVRMFLAVSLLTTGLLLAIPIPSFACGGKIDDSEARADCQGFSGLADVDAGGYSYRGVYIKWRVKLYQAGSWSPVQQHYGQTETKYENKPHFEFSGAWDNPPLCGGDYHVEIRFEAYWASNNSKFDTETKWRSLHCDCDYGSITIVKETDPDGGSGFNFSGSLGYFTLNDNGSRSFDNLAAGDYNVTESVPTDWELDSVECTGDSTSIANGVTIHLDAGEHVTCTFTNIEQDGAERRIKVRKFNDKNGNGNRDCGWGYCEDWLNDWEFTLFRKEGETWVEIATVTTTGSGWSKGTADFGERPTGYEYKIEETRQGGWICTNCTTAEAPFTLYECGCGCKEVKFGNRQPPQRGIKACKFNDEDGSGYKDYGEDWLSGWEFTLYRKEGETWVEIATETTTESSEWSKGCADFGEQPIGYEYKIVEMRQDGWACTNCDTAEEPFILKEPFNQQSVSVSCCPCGSKEVEFGNLQSPACAPGDMVGADTIVRTGNTVSWDITNNSDHSLIIEMIEMSWPSSDGKLQTVKLGGATIFDQERDPTYAKIESGWAGTLADRTIEAGTGGRTETLEFEFQNQAVAGTTSQPYSILVQCVGDGCVDSVEEVGPTVITLSVLDAKSSAGGSANWLWLGLAGLTVLAAGSLFWTKRQAS